MVSQSAMRLILADHPFRPSGRASGVSDYGRVETRARTDPRVMFRPSRSQPLHSHMGQVVKESEEPATVIVTLSVSWDPHDGHECRALGRMAI